MPHHDGHDSQIHIPESFSALYRSRSGRLTLALDALLARYELCEDLARLLAEQAQALYHDGHRSEEGILHGLYAALLDMGRRKAGVPHTDDAPATDGDGDGDEPPPGAVTRSEARWIICLLSETLSWKAPALDGDASGAYSF